MSRSLSSSYIKGSFYIKLVKLFMWVMFFTFWKSYCDSILRSPFFASNAWCMLDTRVPLLNSYVKNTQRHELLKDGEGALRPARFWSCPLSNVFISDFKTQALHFTPAVKKVLVILNLYISVRAGWEYHTQLKRTVSWAHAVPSGLAWVGSRHLPLISEAHVNST